MCFQCFYLCSCLQGIMFPRRTYMGHVQVYRASQLRNQLIRTPPGPSSPGSLETLTGGFWAPVVTRIRALVQNVCIFTQPTALRHLGDRPTSSVPSTDLATEAVPRRLGSASSSSHCPGIPALSPRCPAADDVPAGRSSAPAVDAPGLDAPESAMEAMENPSQQRPPRI